MSEEPTFNNELHSGMHLVDALEHYFVTSKCQKQATIDRIGFAINSLSRCLGKEATFDDLTPANLGRFVVDRQRVVKQNTIRGECAKLMALARWGVERGICKPLYFHPPERQIDPPTAFTIDELRLLHKTANNYRMQIGGIAGNVYLVALLHVLYDTGERIGAILQLEWRDIDIIAQRIMFGAATRKGGRQGRSAAISEEAAAALAALKEQGHDRPFGSIHKGTMHIHWGKMLKLAGLPRTRRHGTHAVRRSHASYLHVVGGDAPASLGHASEDITRRHYYDPRITEGQSPHQLLPKLVEAPQAKEKPWWKVW